METHKFKITLTPVSGPGCRVEIDGKEVRVRSISIRASADEGTRVILEVPIAHVEVEGEGIVETTAIGDEIRSFARHG